MSNTEELYKRIKEFLNKHKSKIIFSSSKIDEVDKLLFVHCDKKEFTDKTYLVISRSKKKLK